MLRYLIGPVRLSSRTNVKELPQLYKYDVWGPRKTWIKEVQIDIEKKSDTLWGPNRRAVWDKKQQKMVVKYEEHSDFKEKALIMRGRLERVFFLTAKKHLLELQYRRQLRKYQKQYYVSNFPYNNDKRRELIEKVGPILLSVHILMDRQNCAIQYERNDLPGEPKEWLECFRALKCTDPRDVNVTAIDARYSLLGYQGLGELRACKNLQYLNASYAPRFDNHCMTRLHMVSETLEYLDLSGSSVDVRGLGYLRLLAKLKWINLSNLPNQPDMERYLPYIKEIVPPDCVIVVKSDEEINHDLKRLAAGGDKTSLTLGGTTSEDVRNLFKLPEAGKFVGSSLFFSQQRRRTLIKNFNEERIMKKLKLTYYRKHAEHYPPLF